MRRAADLEPIRRIEEQARRRYSKWSERAWVQLIEAGAIPLAQSFESAPGASTWRRDLRERVLETYLTLAAEGVGSGQLFFETNEMGSSLQTWIWKALIPSQLAKLPSAELAIERLTQLWNLGENLDARDPWVKSLILLELKRQPDLESFEERLSLIANKLETGDLKPLTSRRDADTMNVRAISLSQIDRDAVAGSAFFVAPRVLQVADANRPRAYLFYLAPEAIGLGLASLETVVPAASTPKSEAPDWAPLAAPIKVRVENGVFDVVVPELSQRVWVGWSK